MSAGEPADKRWPPDPGTVDAARAGDGSALGEILMTGFPRLVAFYRGVGLSATDAEELAAETTEGIVRSFPRLRDVASFEGWFWTVARNRLRSRLRTLRRTVNELDYPLVPDPGDLAVQAEEHAAIRRALDRLPPRDRMILWLREVEGLEYEDIGLRLALPGASVRVAALRARRRLEAAYREIDGPASG